MAAPRMRGVPMHDHRPDAETERRGDIGWLLGLAGAFALAFSLGRSSAPGGDCCERLITRDHELILCEGRLLAPPLA